MTEKVDVSREAVQKTGRAFLIAAVGVGLLMGWKNGFGSNGWKWCIGIGALFCAASYFIYAAMRPIHIGWMKFAQILGWASTRIILGIFFFVVLTPIGLLMRMFGKDLLDQTPEPMAVSYWKKRTPSDDPQSLERQF